MAQEEQGQHPGHAGLPSRRALGEGAGERGGSEAEAIDTVSNGFSAQGNWKRLTVADLVDEGQVKKAYHKALLVCHPDKVKHGGGSLDEIVQADMVFDALKDAWGKFKP